MLFWKLPIRDVRTPMVGAVALMLVAAVSLLADWTEVGLQDPARTIGVGPAGTMLIGSYSERPPFNVAQFAIFVVIGLAFVLCGLLAQHARAQGHTGVLLWSSGLIWLLGGIRLSSIPWAFTVGAVVTLYYVPLLIHTGLVFPGGRLVDISATRRRFVFACYGFFVLAPFFAWPFYDPRLHVAEGTSTSSNLLLIRDWPAQFRFMSNLAGVIYVLIAAIAFGLLTTTWKNGTRPFRRAFLPLWLAFLVMSIAKPWFTLLIYVRLAPFGLSRVVLWLGFTTPLWSAGLVPIAVLVGLSRLRGDRTASAQLIVSASKTSPLDNVENLVRSTLHDPNAELWTWLPQDQRYVGVSGDDRSPMDLKHSQTLTVLNPSGTGQGALVYDRALLQDASVVETVCATTSLLLQNLYLAESLSAQLDDARESRRRIVTATDSERRRLERNIHDGTQQQLIAAALTFARAQRAVDKETTDELVADGNQLLAEAITDLRELVRGLHPPILRDRGLSAALHTLAERTPIPVRVRTDPVRRPPQLEACLYFAAAEAVTNAVKHSHATQIDISLSSDDGQLVLIVADNGCGGGRAEPGGGLAGLQDRFSALSGNLTITTSEAGTAVQGRLPLTERNGTL